MRAESHDYPLLFGGGRGDLTEAELALEIELAGPLPDDPRDIEAS